MGVGGLGSIEQCGLAELRRRALLVESLGFDEIWIDNPFLGLGGIVNISALLIVTEQTRIVGTGFDSLTLHSGQIAQHAAAFQHVSGDRFALVLRPAPPSTRRLVGGAAGEESRGVREAAVAVRRLLRGLDLSEEPLAGGPWSPVARLHHPRRAPVWVEASDAATMSVALQHAEGLVCDESDAESVMSDVATFTQGGHDLGSGFDMITRLAWTPDQVLRRSPSDRSSTLPRPPGGARHMSAEVMDRCMRLIEFGVRHIVVELHDDSRWDHEVSALARQVLPPLRRSVR